MKILYVFPHPDDESFGPAPAISSQLRRGHEVYLLTLTKGEATKQRHRLGVDKAEMGAIRYKEMQCVEERLGLSGMRVLDLPDGKLKKMDPLDLEEVIREHVMDIRPDILVTYPVHGVSGFEDHLVTHAVVKHAWCSMRREGGFYPRRLAFFTHYSEEEVESKFNLRSSEKGEIDCWVETDETDRQAFLDALDCYRTYQQVIEESGVKNAVGKRVPFEIFQEEFDQPLKTLDEKI